MKKASIKLIFIAAALAIGITFLISRLTNTSDPESGLTMPSELDQSSTVDVLVSLVDLAPYSAMIDEAMLDTIKYPDSRLPRGAAIDKTHVIGRLPSAPIYANEIVMLARLVEKDQYRESLRQLIPAGHRAITITVDSLAGVAGFISQGDIVDLIAVYEKKINVSNSRKTQKTKEAKLRLQNLKVLIVGSQYNPVTGANKTKNIKGDLKKKSITLAVRPKKALQIHHIAQKSGGLKFRIVLKNSEDLQEVNTSGFSAYEMEDETLKILKTQNGVPVIESNEEFEETVKTVHHKIERWAGTRQLQTESFTTKEKVLNDNIF